MELDPVSLVSFKAGCSDRAAFVPGYHEAGDTVPCPDCAGEHRIKCAIQTTVATNLDIREVEPEEDEAGL